MKTISTIAKKEYQTAFRNKLFVTIAVLFLFMSVLSVYIGSTTKRHEMSVYNDTVASLTAKGVTELPPRPEIHTLTILANLTEYVSIVGAILAVVLGYNALIEEKESGTLKIILSRPVFRDQFLTGKLLGLSGVIASLLGLAFIFNILLLILVGGIFPTMGEIARLFTLVVMGFVYMLIFLTLSMTLSIKMKDNATVFLVSLVVWVLFSFVIPQMAETQMANSTVINSISGVTNQIPQDTAISQAINYLSPTWYFRTIGAQLLEVTPGSAGLSFGTLFSQVLTTLLVLLVPSVLFGAFGYATFLRDETLVLE